MSLLLRVFTVLLFTAALCSVSRPVGGGVSATFNANSLAAQSGDYGAGSALNEVSADTCEAFDDITGRGAALHVLIIALSR